jgi:hypothetical protein
VTGFGDVYDEGLIRASLAGLTARRRVAFACAMAECLLPMTEQVSGEADRGEVIALRGALDVAWRVVAGEEPSASELVAARDLAMVLVPDDQNEDWATLSPLRQNAAAAVAYALDSSLRQDPQDAAWAALQVYEATDYLVQLTAPEHSYYESATSTPVSLALDAIREALYAAGAMPLVELRGAAVAAGIRFFRDLLAVG